MGKTCTLPTGQSQYQVVGRFVPNEKYGEGHAQCKVYRMKHRHTTFTYVAYFCVHSLAVCSYLALLVL